MYRFIPDPADNVTATNVIVRMVDALAFRYKWSLEGLSDEHLLYRASSDSMSLKELLEHIYYLTTLLYKCFVKQKDFSESAESIDYIKEKTLVLLKDIRDTLATIDDKKLSECNFKPRKTGDEIPFWYFLNGPLADALTHVGQINFLRRLAANPALKVDLFRGKPPAGL